MSDETSTVGSDRLRTARSEPGVCPKCGGHALIYRNPEDDTRGHIYCRESSCEWMSRNRPNVDRFVEGVGDE